MLIDCPNCGKCVSDRAEKCTHCGYEISSAKEERLERKLIDYNAMSGQEQTNLMGRFEREMPYESKYIKNFCKLSSARGVLLIVMVILGAVYTLMKEIGLDVGDLILIIMLLSGIGVLLGAVVLLGIGIVLKIKEPKYIRIMLTFRKWCEQQGVLYGFDNFVVSKKKIKKLEQQEEKQNKGKGRE